MLQLSLPDELEARVQAHTRKNGRDIADWIASALENQLKQESLEAKMAEALASGPPQRTDDKWWQDLQDDIMRKLEAHES